MMDGSVIRSASTIRVGLPKGNVLQRSFDLIGRYEGEPVNNKALHHMSRDGMFEFFVCKQRDIPYLLRENVIDIGVAPIEWIAEKQSDAHVIKQIDWCSTRIVLLSAHGVQTIGKQGTIICVTEFPNLASGFFEKQSIADYRIVRLSGSCEAFVPKPYDCAVECVETGTSAKENGLYKEADILTSHMQIICRPDFDIDAANQAVVRLGL